MRLSEITYEGSAPIDSYGPGFFRIAGVIHEGATLVLPDGPQPWGGPSDWAAITALKGAFDVLLIGTGAEIANLPQETRAALDRANIGHDLMATPTACRSYNILLAEGRRVIAALLAL